MRRNAIAEVAGSLIIAVLTSIYTLVGLAGYVILGFYPSTKTFGIVLLLVGIVSLPICVMWSLQLAKEITMRAPSGLPNASRTPPPSLNQPPVPPPALPRHLGTSPSSDSRR